MRCCRWRDTAGIGIIGSGQHECRGRLFSLDSIGRLVPVRACCCEMSRFAASVTRSLRKRNFWLLAFGSRVSLGSAVMTYWGVPLAWSFAELALAGLSTLSTAFPSAERGQCLSLFLINAAIVVILLTFVHWKRVDWSTSWKSSHA